MVMCVGMPGDLVGRSDKQVGRRRLSYASGRVYARLSTLLFFLKVSLNSLF